jgi:hypothetical protein
MVAASWLSSVRTCRVNSGKPTTFFPRPPLLECVCSFWFEPREFNDPFPPMTTLGASRTATPHDIADTDIEFLRELAPEVKDPELRAKLGYLVWLRMRDHQRLERTPRLAVLLGNQELNEQFPCGD